ncbi:hypothetical protein [Streptomyces neyagawaensis]|uniref:Transposase n=1 Tax=Streptomyces neyagawaensis TaxID=42238 RepID=A0ABV3B9M1_9ACTN
MTSRRLGRSLASTTSYSVPGKNFLAKALILATRPAPVTSRRATPRMPLPSA